MKPTLGDLMEEALKPGPLLRCRVCGVTNRMPLGERGWYQVRNFKVCSPCYHKIAEDAIMAVLRQRKR